MTTTPNSTHDVRPGQRRRHRSNSEEIIILAPDPTRRDTRASDWFYWCTLAGFADPRPLTERLSNSARALATEYPVILSEDWQDLTPEPEPEAVPQALVHTGQVRARNPITEARATLVEEVDAGYQNERRWRLELGQDDSVIRYEHEILQFWPTVISEPELTFQVGQAVRILNISPRRLDESEGGIIGQRGEVLGPVGGARSDYRVQVTQRDGRIRTWEFGNNELEPWTEPRPFRVGDRVRGPERARNVDRSFRTPSRWDGRRIGTVTDVRDPRDGPYLHGDVTLTLDADDEHEAETFMLYFADELELLEDATGRFSERDPAAQVLPSGPASVTNPLQVLATELLAEAKNRGWCSEYDDFARRVNGLLPEPVLMDREGNLARPQLPEQSFVVRVTYRPLENPDVRNRDLREVMREALTESEHLGLQPGSVRINVVDDSTVAVF